MYIITLNEFYVPAAVGILSSFSSFEKQLDL